MSEHTPTPWAAQHIGVVPNLWFVVQPNSVPPNVEVAMVRYSADRQHLAKANAEFIVRACNSHGELVDAVKLLLAALDEGHPEWIEKAHSQGIAAIYGAEGRE